MAKTLIIFVKNAQVGKVKSRLAKSIGAERALYVYKKLVQKTKDTVLNLLVRKTVYYSDYIEVDDLWSNDIFKKCTQKGADLGERMFDAICEESSEPENRTCLVGSDIPNLSEEIIIQSFELLSNYDIVLGPAEDGGYYLIAMKFPVKELFINKSWSTKYLLEETIAEIKRMKLSYALLPILNDIDVIEDIHKAGLDYLLT